MIIVRVSYPISLIFHPERGPLQRQPLLVDFDAPARADAQYVLKLFQEVVVETAVQHGIGARRRHPHQMADRVRDLQRLRREIDVVRVEIGDQVEEMQGHPADAEDDGDGAEQKVGAVEAAPAELAAVRFVRVGETGGESAAEFVGDADVDYR